MAVIAVVMAVANAAGVDSRNLSHLIIAAARSRIALSAAASRWPLFFDHGCARVQARTIEEGVVFMADEGSSQENIDIPPIPKETAGAVAGAAVGSMMGPVGAVVGGVIGALAGKAAGEGRLKPAAKKVVARITRPAGKRTAKSSRSRNARPSRGTAKSRKRSTRKRTKAKPRKRLRSSRAKSRRRRR